MRNSEIKTKLGRVRAIEPVSRNEAIAFWITGIALIIWSVIVPLFFLLGFVYQFDVLTSQEIWPGIKAPKVEWWNWLFVFTSLLCFVVTSGKFRVKIGNAVFENRVDES